jgi:hypothetical protein
MHVPALHVSTPLQMSPSEHEAPSFALALHTPAAQVACALHGSPSSHELPSGSADPATHCPAEQAPGVQTSALQASPLGSGVPAPQLPTPSHFSTPLHALPSEHDVPAARFAPGTHTPVALHVPAPWQALPAEQAAPGVIAYVMAPVAGLHVPTVQMGPLLTLTAVPAHVPAVQTSPVVHAFPSLQAVPSGAVTFEQVPVLGLHVPATWHWSEGAHVTVVPAHAPLVHTSLVVHALPSLHVVPFVAVGLEHAPVLGLQVPAAWH